MAMRAQRKRFGPTCDIAPPIDPAGGCTAAFLVSRHQSRLAVGIHPEVLMPGVDDHLVQPRCRDDGLDSRLMSAQRGHHVRRSAGTAI